MTKMIRIERGKEVKPGVWAYSVGGFAVQGRSRQPLLDACRQLKPLLGDTERIAGVFRNGSDTPDIFCPVSVGARYTVEESIRDRPKFAKFRKWGKGGEQDPPPPSSIS